ncbi:MAG: flagellar basal-body rod protein FlgG [Dehalococcoidales bacterium]|nr:flagellar basal-body rod protein FlgG [Dehalococcoidales bacterium]
MSSILKSAASGLLAQKYNLDVIANNIANISTTGFKKSRATFADAAYENAVVNAPETRTGTGVTIASAQRMFSQGSFAETGNPWDLAIAGDGFFQVALPDGRKAFTRDGSFQVDAQDRLTTGDGLLVDPPVTIPYGAENVTVDPNGAVSADVNGQRVTLGNISVVTFPNPEGLLAIGHNLYAPSEASGDAQAGQAGAGGRGQIVSGVLEGSNVDLAEEMTKAMEAQRAYQLSIKVLQTADEMLGLANNIRR